MTEALVHTAEQSLIERRTAAALRMVGYDRASAARVTDAPPGYLAALESGDIVRHVALLSSVPAPGEVRVVVTPGRAAGEWHLDVAARDRPGLLAACTGVLADRDIAVVQAVLATWDDGAALEAFVVRSSLAPDAGVLQPALAASLRRPQSSPPLADAVVTFDHTASTVYTACEIQAADRPGLLHALAVAFAAAGADVHAALVATVGDVACDRFDLSDKSGRKLDPALEATIRRHIRDGVAAPARRRWIRRNPSRFR